MRRGYITLNKLKFEFTSFWKNINVAEFEWKNPEDLKNSSIISSNQDLGKKI